MMQRRRFLAFAIAALCLLPVIVAAAQGLELESELKGSCEGFSYVLPCFSGSSEDVDGINGRLRAVAENGLQECFPELAYVQDGAEVTYTITRNDERYLCVLLQAWSQETLSGERAYTFARDGIHAGQNVSLAQVLGLESETGTEELDHVVYGLIWETVRKESENMDRGFLDGLTLDSVIASLDPHWDFRLEETGNIVFMIQPGEIAAEMEGMLEFPFMPEELVDAMK